MESQHEKSTYNDFGASLGNTQLSSDDSRHKRKRSITGFRWLVVCIAIFSANFVYGLDTTITATVQAAVSDTFNNTTELGWLGVGFALGSVAAMGPIGMAYGVFNIKWLYVGCLMMFAAASALCGAAPSINGMIVGRVWAGFAGAGMYIGTLNLFTRMTTPEEQPVYMGAIGFVNGLGEILGPIIGGRFADSATWRWGFYINLLIFVIMGPVYVFAIPSLPNQLDRSFRQKIMGLDLLGILLSIAVYGTFTVALTFGGSMWPWNDDIPLYFLYVDGATGTEAAVRLLPFVICYIFSILFCGAVMRHTGWHIIWFLVTGALMTASGATMYAILDIDTPKAQLYGISAVLGFGFSTSMSAYALAPHMVSDDQVPFVIQLLTISQGQGQLIGLAIASAIFQNKSLAGLNAILNGHGFSEEQISAAISGAKSVVLQSVDSQTLTKCMREEVYMSDKSGK
ncbi:Putative HC-toxin efflux carrier TOXA [Talaromyces islandicus]|uniref:Putative HC-toxin efflux carrier TOXA n=1 Tax=Talaromyces islandicus TaxID=28573 RepID=A0A0U1M9S5_TALIS|nr:Putative HC-toxin efflux carrier TOXA [Talaromyces islandicus]